MIERKELSKEDIAHRAYELFLNAVMRTGIDVETGQG